MEEKLNILPEDRNEYTLLKIEGRIDGYWSKQLDEYLDNTLRTGNYRIALDLKGVNYMSSLGIRVLVKYAKLYRQVNGGFGITETSKNVADLLDMAGLTSILRWQPAEVLPPVSIAKTTIESDGYLFDKELLKGQGLMQCYYIGNPGKMKAGGYGREDCKTVSFGKNRYGIGVGAIGIDFDDCVNRFGEFVALGDSVVYSPAGRSQSPDYMLKAGALIPKLEMLYGIVFEGPFDNLIGYTPTEPDHTIKFSKLLTKIFEITGYEKLVMVMLAETSGLVGLSLNYSPVAGQNVLSNPFTFPEVRERVNFTTEPEYKKMMTVTVGIASKNSDSVLEEFTRSNTTDDTIRQHFHTAIFSYHPYKKTGIDLNETISSFFEHDKIRGILHLVNDAREYNGIGESEFTGGVCWVSKINQ